MFARIIKPSLQFTTHCLFSTSQEAQLIKPLSYKSIKRESVTKEAERVFKEFFNENPPKENEKQFLYADLKEDVENKSFEPYKILGLKETASQDDIKEAYRKSAIESHPLINESKEAIQKFIDVSRAYEILTENLNSKNEENFMWEFESLIKEKMSEEEQIYVNFLSSKIKRAEVYSESKKVKKFGSKTEIKIVKEYNLNGKLVKVTRIEVNLGDGETIVEEILEEGDEIKTRIFTKEGMIGNYLEGYQTNHKSNMSQML